MFKFERHDVSVPAISWLEDRLIQKRGGWLYGSLGTGKSHAIRKAVRGGLRADVSSGPLLGQRIVMDLARQLGSEGSSLLEAFRSGGLEASLGVAEQAVNGRPLVVDGVDALFPAAASPDDPATTLWQEEKTSLLDWLRRRVTGSPTFLVSRGQPEGVDSESTCKHEAPWEWPIRLRPISDSYTHWNALGNLAQNNPAILTLAGALVPLLPVAAFEALVTQAQKDRVNDLVLLQRLGQVFRLNAPPSWQKALALVHALGEIPRDVLDRLLERRAGGVSAGHELEPLPEGPSPIERLLALKLMEERSGTLSLLPALAEAGAIRGLTQTERDEILPAIAHRLLAPVNDLGTLAPKQADRVLRAHAIFVELGDMSQAERTAVLHVHGLVELARRTSLNDRYPDAWRQYDALFRMMQSGSWSAQDGIGRRLFSYVRHYRARDGARAGVLDDATCLAEYRQALDGWPENALWHQRYIEALIRLGRPIEAMQAVERATKDVPEHPRREELLRVRPAGAALRSGLPLLSLELIEPVLAPSEDVTPEVADGCKVLLRRWEKGIAFSELPFRLDRGDAEGYVVFHVPVEVTLRRTGDTWVARLPRLSREGRASKPHGALQALARYLADETRRLVSTPTSRLDDRDVWLKGRLLSVVDVLNSDIGLKHATQRWIVGRIQGNELLPTMQHLPPIEVPDTLLPESTEGLYFAQVPVYRDGIPSGPATRLAPAGSGLDTGALLELLARMPEDAA